MRPYNYNKRPIQRSSSVATVSRKEIEQVTPDLPETKLLCAIIDTALNDLCIKEDADNRRRIAAIKESYANKEIHMRSIEDYYKRNNTLKFHFEETFKWINSTSTKPFSFIWLMQHIYNDYMGYVKIIRNKAESLSRDFANMPNRNNHENTITSH